MRRNCRVESRRRCVLGFRRRFSADRCLVGVRLEEFLKRRMKIARASERGALGGEWKTGFIGINKTAAAAFVVVRRRTLLLRPSRRISRSGPARLPMNSRGCCQHLLMVNDWSVDLSSGLLCSMCCRGPPPRPARGTPRDAAFYQVLKSVSARSYSVTSPDATGAGSRFFLRLVCRASICLRMGLCFSAAAAHIFRRRDAEIRRAGACRRHIA